MEETPNTTPETTNLSRRELLKALAAGGGALAAAAFLPARWTRPLIQAGVLPAHAQATCPYILTIDDYSPDQQPGQFIFYTTWVPCAPTQPTSIWVWIGDLQAAVTNVTYQMTGGEYCGATIYATRNLSSTGFGVTIQVNYDRYCNAVDTFTLPN
jgi:hypothetical protein